MKLFVKDRFYLLNLLPHKPVDYKTYNLKKELVKQVQLSEEDNDKYQIKQDEETGSISWNPQIDQENPIELEITKDLAKYLNEACEGASEKEFTDDVWEFVERVFNECAQLVDNSKAIPNAPLQKPQP